MLNLFAALGIGDRVTLTRHVVASHNKTNTPLCVCLCVFCQRQLYTSQVHQLPVLHNCSQGKHYACVTLSFIEHTPERFVYEGFLSTHQGLCFHGVLRCFYMV